MNDNDHPLAPNSGTSSEAHQLPDYRAIEARLNEEFSLDRWFYNPKDGAFYSFTPIGVFLSEISPGHWVEEVRYYDGYESEGDIEVEGSLDDAITEIVTQVTFSSFEGHTLIHPNISVETEDAIVYYPITPLQRHEYWEPCVTNSTETTMILGHLIALGQHDLSQEQALDFLNSLLDTSESPVILPVAEYIATALLTHIDLGIDIPTEEKLFTWLIKAAELEEPRPLSVFAALLGNRETQGPIEQKACAMAAWTPVQYEDAFIEALEAIEPSNNNERREFYTSLSHSVPDYFRSAIAQFLSRTRRRM